MRPIASKGKNMVIDAHTHISIDENEKYPHDSLEDVIREMDRSRIDRCVVFPLAQCNYEENISFLKKTVDHPDRFIPLAFINPLYIDEDQIDELLSDIRLFGIKINPREGRYDCRYRSILAPLMKAANRYGKHVLISYTSDDEYIDLSIIEELADTYSDATFQIGHMGSIYECSGAIRLACLYENVYLDSCSASVNALRRAILNCPKKLLMGCDYPFGTYDSELIRLKEACRLAGKEEVLSDLTGGNLQNLLKRKG